MSYLAFSGGVGGAKLAVGLAEKARGDALTIVVNTGDDFEHLGLSICPDLDTVMYTLAGVQNPETGWGRAGETWSFLHAIAELGGESWFRLGDRDLATHVERTRRLRAGESLSQATAALCRALQVTARVVPMSDQPVRTMVQTQQGELPFQRYFVAERCAPRVRGFRFEGAEQAQPSAGFLAALARPDLRAIVICPSNPFVSVDPILAVPGVEVALRARRVPLVAVSPLVGGQAVKGPLGKMLSELGLESSAIQIARHYRERGLLDGFVLDRADAGLERAIGVPTLVTNTMMNQLAERIRLAEETLAFTDSLPGRA